MNENLENIITDFVDFLLPELTPYETTMYLLLLRKSYLENDSNEVRVGKRTLIDLYGKGSKGAKTNYAHISRLLKGLEEKGCLEIGNTTQEGTLYLIALPSEIPIVREKIVISSPVEEEEDYFTKADKRKEIFERDEWICFYCGEEVTTQNATLDHFHPQHLGGNHSKENLKTSCLTCNSIKSGKSYYEAAPFILKSIQERRKKANRQTHTHNNS